METGLPRHSLFSYGEFGSNEGAIVRNTEYCILYSSVLSLTVTVTVTVTATVTVTLPGSFAQSVRCAI